MKQIIKNKRWLYTNRRGLSLIELLFGMAIFSITILASVAVSGAYLKGSLSLKKYQANNEELSLALNYVSKDIRMSNTLTPTTNGVRNSIALKENSGAAVNVTYNFVGGNLERNGQIIASGVNGQFYVVNAAQIPLITVVISKTNPSGGIRTSVQTTTSMRSGYK